MSHEDHYRIVANCRICGSKNLHRYLDLGNLPLVNSYIRPTMSGVSEEFYPLQINYCLECSQSQLSVVVDPKILYKHYFYRSSISKTFTKHCYETAQYAVNRFELSREDLVLDIASNDGCALREFRKHGVRVVGVDPAENLRKIAADHGIPTFPAFWNVESAEQILAKWGQASLISAMNVFAHVDDLHQFLAAVHVMLKDRGVFVIEVPYLFNFVNKTEFDTTYHEHLSYFLVKPLIKLFNEHRLTIFNITQYDIHGGSIRVYVRKATNEAISVDTVAIQRLLDLEKGLDLHQLATYLSFPKDVIKIKTDLLELLHKLKRLGKIVAAYGASAKGTVLSNYCGITQDLVRYVIDDTPEKQGYLTPGSHIKIVPRSYLQTHRPDYLLLFAWNFADELLEKTKDYQGAGGRYIIPVPTVRVI